MTEKISADLFLDITSQVCPLTFVKTKLMVERMDAGQTLEVRLNAGEPLENVPRSLIELGHSILSVSPNDWMILTESTA
ncbi:sulfurtransferase TusA family protein [Azospirillum sp. TSA2s]|uniref:sulfurtransferase TusA family protein n=1 Tax=Azospirillum sp. TSA2s TaxID=709810 RepID=UPI0026CD628B